MFFFEIGPTPCRRPRSSSWPRRRRGSSSPRRTRLARPTIRELHYIYIYIYIYCIMLSSIILYSIILNICAIYIYIYIHIHIRIHLYRVPRFERPRAGAGGNNRVPTTTMIGRSTKRVTVSLVLMICRIQNTDIPRGGAPPPLRARERVYRDAVAAAPGRAPQGRHRLNGYLARRVPSLSLASSSRTCLNWTVLTIHVSLDN